MKSNAELQNDVQNAIRWEPSMHAAEIGVTTEDGVVTLFGTVDSYSKKINAERATKNVVGVRAVAEDITVDYGSAFTKNDTDIAKSILDSWEFNWQIPKEQVKITVENGWVNLEGKVAWKYQEEAAEKVIKNLAGVIGITNLIEIKSELSKAINKQEIERALARNWALNSHDIKVDVHENDIKLTGSVDSLYQKEEAGRLAWNAPGVRSVENDLSIINKLKQEDVNLENV